MANKLIKLNFFISALIRFYMIGWMLIIFGALEIGIRITVFIVNLKYLKRGLKTKLDKYLLLSSQLLFFLSAMFTFDFGDQYAYGFLRLIQNPGRGYELLWFGLALLLVVVNVVIMVRMRWLRKRETFRGKS